MSKWTRFMDMHSGGGAKEKPHEYIYIEAPEDEAKVIFYNRFGHNPDRVSCTCCGSDYSITESESLKQASAYDRNCEYDSTKNIYIEEESKNTFSNGKYKTVAEYLVEPGVLAIYSKDIEPHERFGELPEQGYVWVD